MAERDAQGRFIKGHKPVGKPSPGRPKRKTEEKYLRWMAARVKKEDWDMIVDSAISGAKSGDNVARQWLSNYLIGYPRQQVALEGEVGVRLPEIVEIRVREDSGGAPPGASGDTED